MDGGELKELPLGRGYILRTKGGTLLKRERIVYLFEWQEYMIIGNREFSVKTGEYIARAEKINKDTYIANLQFKNYIGKARIEIIDEEGRLTLEWEVLSDKVGKIYREGDIVEKHERLYRALVDSITKKAVALPFSVSTPTAFSVKESEEPVNELFAYHFLVNNRERIISAYEEILKRPHRKLVEREEWVNFWEVSEVEEGTVLSIVTHPEYLVKSSTSVAKHLKGYAPLKVSQGIKYESFDTHENRFTKHFLNELIMWGERAISAILNSSYLTREQKEKAVSNLKPILEDLEYYATSDIFEDVGEMGMFPYTSQVLLKREGYRDLLQLWREFKSYSPFFDEMQRAINNKNIPKLYEYWCFFKLVEELGEILRSRDTKIIISPLGELSEEGDVYAEFDNGWRLYYNKKLTSKKWSYSVSLRPDFSLFDGDPNESGTKLIGIFDAKFKVDIARIDEFAEEDREMEQRPDLKTWAKLEDIYKMHTYKDALRAKFAVVLYPGEGNIFFEVDEEAITDFALCHVINKKLEGIGYLGLIPR
ncbi:DUF2357 domain-containing protein [Pyrococcus kukulkanii]|uniref:DUF2357 domain-containing protein n=1 Tax=Pyrococcus kukulkanii TaxID=1609559 RepID=A0A127B9A5_9EURY|nr:DUF2357 domain-containing protein [Pyrococcus kukulkanii]AMM53825.1 hypothetical protein TQ32_04500 [Pyrococcus kukulkanii]